MEHQRTLILFVGVLLVIGAGEASASAQCQYEFIPAADPTDGSGLVQQGLGEDSSIGGYTNGFVNLPSIWDGGPSVIRLALPAGFEGGRVTCILNQNAIVGRTWPPNPSVTTPTFWLNGVPQILPTPPGIDMSIAQGINKNHLIVGHASGINQSGVFQSRIPVLWDNGVYTELETLLGGISNSAEKINDQGQIAGWMRTPLNSDEHLVLWTNGKAEILGQIPGGTRTKPAAINNHTQIVGAGWDTALDTNRPFLWEYGTFTLLSIPPDILQGTAVDINNAGQIVGWVNLPAPASGGTGILWQDGQSYDLTDLTPIGIVVIQTWGINDEGVIAVIVLGALNGNGILVPIDSPAGDIDNNCKVNVADLLTVLTEWGKPNSIADTDHNGTVNVQDLLQVLTDWG